MAYHGRWCSSVTILPPSSADFSHYPKQQIVYFDFKFIPHSEYDMLYTVAFMKDLLRYESNVLKAGPEINVISISYRFLCPIPTPFDTFVSQHHHHCFHTGQRPTRL